MRRKRIWAKALGMILAAALLAGSAAAQEKSPRQIQAELWLVDEAAAAAEAARRVAAVPGDGAGRKLDLWDLHALKALPPEISRLTALRELDANESAIKDLTPLAGLIGLQELNLGATQVEDIAPLAGLTNLRGLRLTAT